jgi:hypothetical protein
MQLWPAGTMLKDKATGFEGANATIVRLGLESFEKASPSPSLPREMLVTLGLYLEGNLLQPHIKCGIREAKEIIDAAAIWCKFSSIL